MKQPGVTFPAVAAALLFCPFALLGGDFSGIWVLNVAKSSWGKMQKPVNVIIEIDHRQESFRYTGAVSYTSEETREFVFTGAIDGKEYPVTRSFGNGRMTLKRIDGNTIESVFTSDDGWHIETARTVLAASGRQLTRYLQLKTPEGTFRWTEIYEKR